MKNLITGILTAALLAMSAIFVAPAMATPGKGEGHSKRSICHPVNGKGETGNGWNIIEPSKASRHIDERTGAGKHVTHDGRTDVYADAYGKCPGAPVTEPTTPAPTTQPTTEPTTAPTTEPTQEPTVEPTTDPTTVPTTEPTTPVTDPTEPVTEPTETTPTTEPTEEPTTEPTEPTTEPTTVPTTQPTTNATPTAEPTVKPKIGTALRYAEVNCADESACAASPTRDTLASAGGPNIWWLAGAVVAIMAGLVIILRRFF